MTMEEENFRETSLDVAPLISDAKATQAWRRFLGTVLGGARIAPGMPLRLYLLQLVIWGFPVILCSGTLLLVPAEPLYWRPVVAGAANGVFTLSVEALRIWLHRRPSEPGAPKAAWFADDDGLDFQSLSPTVVEFLLPRKRPFLLCLLLALSAFLGAASAAALGPKRLEQQGLDPTSAVVASAWVQLCVATAAFGLHGEAPVELSGRGGEVWPRASRPLLVTALLLPVGTGVGAASMRLLVVVSLLPLGWALGVVPPIDSLIIWSLEQVEVHFFGGTAATDVRRLALALVASAAAAAALGAATPGLHAVDIDPDWRAAVVGGICLALAACVAPLPPRARDMPKALCRATSALLQAAVAGSAASVVLGVGRLPEELLGFLRLGIEQVCVVLILFAVYAVSAWHFSARVCGFRRPGYNSARAKLLWGETGSPPNSPLPRRNSRVSDILQAEKPLHPDVTSGRSGGADAGAKATTGITRVYVGLETLVRICLLFHLAVGSSKELVDRGMDGITAEVFLVAALVLRQARIIMSQTPRAAVDTWLAGLLHLASPAYPLFAQVFVVSVLRQRALLLLSHLRYVLHLCRVTASVPKLRHPVTGPLLWINVLLFPGLLLVVAIATVLEAPLITIFTLPLFAVGGPRPRHGHIDGSPVEKGLEGLFYSSLEPSLLRGLARRFRVQALPTTPGSAFLCRSHERLLCLVRVLACGFGWVEVELRGLEMQEPTSCHHVEAGLIDDAFAAAFGDLPGRPNDDEAKTRAEPFLFEPVAEVPALGYEQTLVSLRGLLDNPEALRQVHRLFLKSLVFVLSRDLQRRDGKLPEGWLSCPLKSQDMQAAMNLITTASWPPDVAEVLAMPDLRLAADTRQQQQQQPNLEEVYVDSPRSLDNQDSPPLPPGSPPVIRPDTPQRTKGRRQRSERSSTASSLRVRTRTDSADTNADQEEDLDALMDQVLGMDAQTPERPPEVNRSAVGASKNVRKLLSTTSPDGEQQRGLLTMQAAASSSKKEAFRPQTPPSQRTTPAASPKGGMSPGMSGVNSLTLKGLRTFSSDEGTRAQSQANQGPPQLGDLATLVVEAYVAINVAPAFGQIPESLGISHVHRIFSGSIAEGAQVPELLWLQSQPELLYLTLKAFRLALKISIDWVAMGDDLSDLEYSTLAETASELERTWYLGPEGSSKWEGAMRRRVPNLMSMRKKGHSEVQILRLRLAEDSVRIGQVRSSVLESLWASCAFELRYLANDDDERYSIQAHPTLFRNLAVQSAEYPIYVSRPTTLWL